MAGDLQLEFIRKWHGRGASSNDPFDRFFSLWIALVVAAQRMHTRTGADRDADTDREKVLAYFAGNAEKVSQVLRENEEILRRLASRRGTRHRGWIVDTGNRGLQTKFRRLSAHYLSGAPLAATEAVDALAELLNRIRNNVFHGIKVYDSREDLELLNLVNPLLQQILVRCELRRSGNRPGTDGWQP